MANVLLAVCPPAYAGDGVPRIAHHPVIRTATST